MNNKTVERIRAAIIKNASLPTTPAAVTPPAAGTFTPTAMFKNTPSTPAPSYASAYAEAIRSGDASENKTPYTKVMFETFGDDLSHGIDSAVKLGKGWKPVEEVERVETEVENLLPRTKSYVEYYNTLNPGNKFYTVPKSANYTDRIIKGDSEKIDEHFKKSPSNLSAYMHGLSNYVKDTKKNYAQYENKEAYDRVNNEATKLSNMSSDELKLERIGSKSDVTLLERFNELEGYKASIDDAVTSEDKRIAQEHMNAFLNAYGYSDYDSAYKDLYERTKHIPIGKTNKVAYMLPDGQTIMWDDLISDAEHNEYTKEYFTKVSANPDFTAKSTYHKKSVKYESTIIIGEGEYYEPSTKEDQMAHYYNLVNNDPTAVDSCEKTYLTSRGKEDYRYRMYLSEDEKKVFNYLYETQGYESAREYVENMKNILERRRLQDDIKSYTEFAEENPVTASVISTLSSPITNLSGFVGGITGADKTSGLYAGTHFTNTVRSTVENNINSGLGKFLYRHGMNVADNVVALAMGGFGRYGKLSKAATQTIMSTGAFSQAVLNAKERGLSDEEAIFLGAIAGASEYFFESKGFDALFDKDGLMKESAWKYWLNSLKTEEIGELGTELTNDVFDVLVSQDASEWKREIDSYIVSGMTQREAVSKAIGNAASRYGDIALGTLFSTGVMSGTPAVASSAKQAYTDSKTGSWLRSDNADADGEITRSVINKGLDSAPDTESHTYAERMWGRTDAGKKVSDRQLGHMYRANAEAVNTENNTASDIETAEGNYSLDNITGMRSPGYMVNKSPAHLLFEGDVTDPVENAKRYNVIDAEKLSPQTQLEKDVADSALDIGMNNTDATHSLVNTAMKISSESGVPVTFVTTERLKNMGYNTNKYNISGVYSPYNGILINAESPKAGQAILGHELVHWLQGNRLYNSFSKVIKQYSTKVGTYQTTFDGIKNLYSTVKNADYDAETVAELTGAYLFTDEAFVSKLAEHRNLFQRIYDKIRHYYNLATAGSHEARLLERAKHIFEKAYRSQRGKSPDINGDTYLDIVHLDNGSMYVQASRNVIKGTTRDERKQDISKFFDELLDHSESIDIQTIEGDILTITKKDTAWKAKDNYKSVSNQRIQLSENEFLAKLHAASHIDELVEISKVNNKPPVPDRKNHDFAKDGFTYRTVYFRDFDGQYYSVQMSIGHNGRVATVYNVTLKEEGSVPAANIIAAIGSKPDGTSPSDGMLTQNNQNVKYDFSLTPKESQIAEEEVLDFEDDTDAMYSEPSEEFDGRSFEELMGLDGTEKSTSTSKVPEIKLPTAEDILSGNYTPATPVTTPVKEIKLKTGEEIVAEERAKEEALSSTKKFEGLSKIGKKQIADTSYDSSGMINTQPIKEDKGLWGKIKDGANYLDSKLIDSGRGITKIAEETGDDKLYGYYNMARASQNIAAYMVMNAATDINGRATGKSLTAIFEPIHQKGKDYYRKFQEYLYHKHNIDRMSLKSSNEDIATVNNAFVDFQKSHPELNAYTPSQISEIAYTPGHELHEAAKEYMKLARLSDEVRRRENKPVFGPDASGKVPDAKESRIISDNLLAEHPEFAEYAKEVYSYLDNLMDYREASGLITPEQRAVLKKLYPNYVPTFRVTKKGEGRRNKNKVEIGSTIGKAEGGTTTLMPIEQALIQLTGQVVSEGTKNRFGSRLLNDVMKYSGKDYEKSPVAKYVVEEPAKADYFNGAEYYDDTVQRGKNDKATTNTFIVYKDGKRWQMKTNGLLYEAVSALDRNATEELNLMAKTNDVFKKLITEYNPAFLIRNGIKDIQEALFNSKDLSKFMSSYPSAIKQISENGEYWQVYQALGGLNASLYDSPGLSPENTSKVKSDYEKGIYGDESLGEKIIETYKNANKIIEQLPRFA